MFGDLATSVDECRAELVGAYLMDDTDILSLFGFNASSDIVAADITYNGYVQFGVDGLRGLQDFNLEGNKWGQAHSRAHFAMLKCLLTDGNGFMTIDCDISGANSSQFVSIGLESSPMEGQYLVGCCLDFTSIADVKSCREYYEDLSRVDGQNLEWRRIVLAIKQPKWVFVQANTFLEGDMVKLKEYEPTPEGVIQSWAECDL